MASKKEVFKKIIIFVIHISIVSHIKKFVWLKQSVCDFRIWIVSYEIKHFFSCHIYLLKIFDHYWTLLFYHTNPKK